MTRTLDTKVGRLEMIDEDPGYWHGHTRVGERECSISVQASGEDSSVFDRAASIVERVPPLLPHVTMEMAKVFLYDHQEWDGATAAQTVEELAARFRLVDIVIDADGAAELWFRGAFTDHAVTAALSPSLDYVGCERA